MADSEVRGRADRQHRVAGAAFELFAAKLRRPLTRPECEAFDAILLDPPRAGAEAQARMLAGSSVPTIVAVSCNAASFAHDTTLLASGVANHGAIVAITAGQGPAHGFWVIVTSETTTGHGQYAGLPASDHITYAHVIHTPDGFVVRQWSPQS